MRRRFLSGPRTGGVSIVAQFSIPADAVALDRTLSAVPEMKLEVERLATHSREWVMPFVWVSGDDFEAFESALAEDPTVREWSIVENFEETRLYEIRWVETVDTLVDEIVDRHGTVLEASAIAGEWSLKIRFTDQSQVGKFQSYFEAEGVSFTVRRLTHPSAPQQAAFGLTDEQRETLVTAQKEGYYHIPREISVAELAEKFGISSNSISQRLRRGCDTLIRATLIVDENPNEEQSE